jgi:hypothetical protein
MYNDSNIAAWMISGGLKSSDPAHDRNVEHLRALKASRSASPSIVSRLSAAIAAIRPGASPADPDCCPA